MPLTCISRRLASWQTRRRTQCLLGHLPCFNSYPGILGLTSRPNLHSPSPEQLGNPTPTLKPDCSRASATNHSPSQTSTLQLSRHTSGTCHSINKHQTLSLHLTPPLAVATTGIVNQDGAKRASLYPGCPGLHYGQQRLPPREGCHLC